MVKSLLCLKCVPFYKQLANIPPLTYHGSSLSSSLHIPLRQLQAYFLNPDSSS